MLQINKLRADNVIDFAAEELKKYLRMMMPECGDIPISYNPDSSEGFRLGLVEDFGLCFDEVKDTNLDDLVHIETDTQGGILAGSNPRSVLFSVYRYLKENGCRWLFPGVDGEYIPMADITPVSYHHMADHRFRGQCNEGAESQQCMLETIDFYAKLEMNAYMLEFHIPYYYYDQYYSHAYNEKNRVPEPVTRENVLQWKRMCEVEIAKRGLQFHDMGHGWTAEPFGIDSTSQWTPDNQLISEESRQHIALINGKRELYRGVALNTNLCMSNPATRTVMATAIADYASNHQNATYIHVWLADSSRNHCECEECVKMLPSDYYMMIMNELDEILTARNLSTRIVFIAYVDTLFAPTQIHIKNKDRFALLYAPIHRSYTGSVNIKQIKETPAYIRNRWTPPKTSEENAAFVLDWQKNWDGPCFCYEYHYWLHLYRDPGTMYISRRIYEDILTLKDLGMDGFMEDGSQRPFFPNGFSIYIYAEALLNRNCDYDKVKEDYFRHVYGKCKNEAMEYLEQISNVFDFAFMEGEHSVDLSKGKYYNPAQADSLRKVKAITEKARCFAKSHMSLPVRVQTVAMRLLLRHTEYCDMVADMMIEKALGNDENARILFKKLCDDFGRYEIEIERYFDHGLCMHAFERMI